MTYKGLYRVRVAGFMNPSLHGENRVNEANLSFGEGLGFRFK